MGYIVVVGDGKLEASVRALLPNYQVLGPSTDPDLADPVTSLEPIRTLVEAGRAPDAVVTTSIPGFTVLGQVPHLSPTRCYVQSEESIWPAQTVRWLTEATGMAVLAGPEALPALILGRSTAGEGNQEPTIPEPMGMVSIEVGQPGAPIRPSDFEWAEAAPVQVPPAPVTLHEEAPAPAGAVIDAGGPPQTAYLPTDLLRPLRPRGR